MAPNTLMDRPLSLLLVEDDRVDQMAFNRMIRDNYPSLRVNVAGALGDARAILEKTRIDIAVCDFYLGDGTAFEILPELVNRHIPVIVVSGAEDEASAADTIKRGAAEYIVKDQNYNYLKALPISIERALAASGTPDATPVPQQNAPGPAAAASPASALPSESDEVHFRRLVIDPSELIARYRPDGTLLFVNDAFCRYFGKSRAGLIGQDAGQFLPEKDRALLMENRSRLSAADPAITTDYHVLLLDGTSRYIRRTDRALFNDRGVIIEFQMVATDVTERRLAEEALRESEERYRMLAEHAFDGVLVQDPEGTILSVNQSILRMFGFSTPDEILGKSSLSFLSPESREDAAADLRQVINGNQGYVRKYRAVKPDGNEIIVESVGTLIPYKGAMANIVALRDVTDREMATLLLKNELERKRDFINIAAHELRTPLQPVIGYLDLLLDPGSGYSLPPDAKTVLQKVHSYVEAERHMVSQILELSLLESAHEKHLMPELEEVTIADLVRLVIRQGRYDTEAAITVRIPEGITVMSNGPYIYEILNALLANALNYSRPPRDISVDAGISGDSLLLSVTDNGVGIAPDKIEVIFDPFYISDADKLSRKYGRLGIGLTMARIRANHLGGTLTVKSMVGIGSTFTLSLPVNGRT